MAYILKENLALRCWGDNHRVIVKGNYALSTAVDEKLYSELCRLDGSSDYTPSNIKMYIAMGFVEECIVGEKSLNEWQKCKSYDTPYTPQLKIAITEKCNFNCLHCFNAVDNLPISAELKLEKILDILDQARDCGVQGISLTGGEPMLHKDFLRIVDGIYERDMYLYEICTNGSFITQVVLDRFKELGAQPEMKISFDGIGYHEWMRNVKGCEQKTLEKIQFCLDNGFKLGIHFNINRKNRESVLPTLDMLDEMGVEFCKLLPTTPAPRWESNAEGQTFEPKEYMDFVLEIAGEYIKKPHKMNLHFWQLFLLNMKEHTYCFHKIHDPETFDETKFNCHLAATTPAISATGRVYPCMQSSGYFDAYGILVDNIHTTSLHDMLLSGQRLEALDRYSCINRAKHNGICIDCEHFRRCGGGNYCIAATYNRDIFMPDPFQCLMFKEGYEKKFISLFESQEIKWKNTSVHQKDC